MNKTSVIRTLDRRGIRWLATAGASLAGSWTRRRPTIVRLVPGGVFLHRFADTTIALPNARSRVTPRELERDTHDVFCFHYTPQWGDTVLDIGAGYGEETLTFSRLVGPLGRVISVEAHPDTYRRLVMTCKYNNLKNVTPLHVAVADVETTVTIDDGAPERGGAAAATIGGTGGAEVHAVTIDEIIASQGCARVDLLKMNIEGAEQLAIRGMTRSLARMRHVVISCHDFVLGPDFSGDPAWFATYDVVTGFMRDVGFAVGGRRSTDPRPPVRFYVYASHG